MLPYVKINFLEGALGRVAEGKDNVFGILTNAAPVQDGLQILKNYKLTKYEDLADLKVTTANNAGLVKLIKEFYDEAGDETELYIRCFADTVTMTEMLNSTDDDAAKALLKDVNGVIKGLFVHRIAKLEQYNPTKGGGLDEDVGTAIPAAQVIAKWATDTLMSPVFIAISGMDYSGDASELVNLHTMTNNRVAVMIGDTAASTKSCAIGLLAGRLARIPVQRNAGRVKDGAVWQGDAYIKEKKLKNADIAGIHDKGYITLRRHLGLAGAYFSDDPLATKETDDYNSISVRRVADKAYRLAYNTMINELLDEIEIAEDGTIAPGVIKHYESLITNVLNLSMTVEGNCSSVKASMDPKQNVLSTGKLLMTLQVLPVGYAKKIEIDLGFALSLEQ